MRTKMVTRTIYTTNYTVLAVNLASKAVETLTVNIPSADSIPPKKLAGVIDEALPSGYKFVMIESQTVSEKLYGMTEAEFLKYANELLPR